MEIWLVLILLGIIIYFMIERSVARLTRTPIWLIWLVMMTPAIIWSTWWLVYGQQKPMPPMMVIGPFVLCPLLYWWLIQIGRIPPDKLENKAESSIVQENLNSELPQAQPEPDKVRPITPIEEKALRDCFPWGIYYLQQIDYRPQAILCRGKLRTVPENAYKTIKKNVETVFGDRFLVLFQESLQGQPFFALVSNPWSQNRESFDTEPLNRPFVALGLLLLTLVTTTLIGVGLNGISAERLEDWSVLLQGLPYSLGIMSILGLHELGHYFAAIRHKIRATLPYFIPFPYLLGTLGAYILMRSPIPHRKALFDVAITGTLISFSIAIPILIWGLSRSEVVPLAQKSSLLTIEALNPRFSCLLSLISKLALGKALVPGKAIDLHPLAIAGYFGLLFTAFKLMPVGQLDGGRIVHAMYGQKIAIFVGQFARIFMFILAIIQTEARSGFLLWAIFLLLMPTINQPALNDVTELDNKRDFLGLLSLALLIIILLPLPGAIAQWLNI